MERWKEYPHDYRFEVSDAGNVRFTYLTRDVHINVDQYKRRRVVTRRGTKRVAQMVLETFVGPKPPNEGVRHLDGNSMNDALYNITWGTQKQNMQDKVLHGTDPSGERNSMAKLTDQEVGYIRSQYFEGCLQKDLAKFYGVQQAHISKLVNFERRV